MSNETLKIIKQHRNIRNYKEEQITDELLATVLEAGRYAPYSGDEICHFTVVQNKGLQERINLAAKETAKKMDVEHLRNLGYDENFHPLYCAPTLIIISGKEGALAPAEDCAVAVQNMLLAAESVQLGSCWIFFVLLAFMGSDSQELQRDLKIPEGYTPHTAIILGYKAAEEEIPDKKLIRITYLR
ncbi:MAG: nitroreductase family protein [Spirochaetaceae bacterium]|jgi:nitroreductase|nr:nitroreductase family protein [Spirochaetaceae bacterium]